MGESPVLTGSLSLLTIAAAVLHLVMVVGFWRGRPSMVDRMRTAMSTFSADEEKARAHLRGPLAINIAIWGLALAASCIFVSDAFDPAGEVEWVLAFGGIVVLILGVFFDFLIIYYNQPKFLVPPHLRWEPGFRQIALARHAQASKSKVDKAVRELYEDYKRSDGS